MVNDSLINVSVVYVHTNGAWFTSACVVPNGATLADAVRASGVLSVYPDWQLEQLNVGIYGHRQPLDAVLHEHDRVEIYRPLKVDPKDRRIVKVNSTRDARKWRQLNKNNSK